MNIQETLEERGQTHGDFSDNSRVSQELKHVIIGELEHSQVPLDIKDVQVEAIHMICHKLSRIAAGNPNEPDHWHDIAGYAQLVAERLKT